MHSNAQFELCTITIWSHSQLCYLCITSERLPHIIVDFSMHTGSLSNVLSRPRIHYPLHISKHIRKRILLINEPEPSVHCLV